MYSLGVSSLLQDLLIVIYCTEVAEMWCIILNFVLCELCSRLSKCRYSTLAEKNGYTEVPVAIGVGLVTMGVWLINPSAEIEFELLAVLSVRLCVLLMLTQSVCIILGIIGGATGPARPGNFQTNVCCMAPEKASRCKPQRS